MTKPRRLHLSLLLLPLLALLLIAPRADAAWGDLDPTFAAPAGTTQFLPAGNLYGQQTSVMIQPDGKILVAGNGGPDFFQQKPMFQRFMPDGTLDASFGSGGTLIVSTPAAVAGAKLESATLQQDGKILAVANGASNGVLFRITAGGALDTASFASPNGYVLSAGERPRDVLAHSSGDIYVGASLNVGGKPILRRFTSSGTQLGTFASTSTSNLASVAFYDYADVLVREFGSGILMIGTSEIASSPVFFAAKLNSTGALDNTWGVSGKATVAFSIGATSAAAVVQPSGALVIGGGTEVMGDSAWAIARLTAGGLLDASFAGGGRIELNFTSDGDQVAGLANAPDGGIAAAGFVGNPATSGYSGAIRMMTADGFAQSGFGPDGLRTQSSAGSLNYQAVAMQPDGKAVAVGSSLVTGGATKPVTTRFQNYSVPVAAPVLSAPRAKISAPRGKKISGRKLKRFAGTSSTPTGTIVKVEIALQRVDSKLLKKKRRCLWLSSSKVRFKKIKAVKSKCSSPKWLKAKGTSKWSYKLGKKLPKGKYVLSVRARAADGSLQAKPAVKKFKVT